MAATSSSRRRWLISHGAGMYLFRSFSRSCLSGVYVIKGLLSASGPVFGFLFRVPITITFLLNLVSWNECRFAPVTHHTPHETYSRVRLSLTQIPEFCCSKVGLHTALQQSCVVAEIRREPRCWLRGLRHFSWRDLCSRKYHLPHQ